MPPPPKTTDTLIVGGGLAGTLLALALRQAGKDTLIVDDPSLSRCSRVAAGLINPIGGKRLNLVWQADHFIPAAFDFYHQLEKQCGRQLLFPTTINRLLARPEEVEIWSQKKDRPAYRQRHRPINPSVIADLDVSPLQAFAVGGAYLDTETLLQAASNSRLDAGPRLSERFHYQDLRPAADHIARRSHRFRNVVFAEGHLATSNPWFGFVPFKPAKGVIGLVETSIALSETVIVDGYFLIPRHDKTLCVGATYDWERRDDEPDPAAVAELKAFLDRRLSRPWQWIDIKAGVRPATAGAKPVVGPSPTVPSIHAFNGFGSKGSLQIPLLAQQLAMVIAGRAQPEEIIPRNALPARFLKRQSPTFVRWKAVDVAKETALQHIGPGDLAIDATAGNGHDTLWLAQAVGKNGRVFALDIQPAAIAQTRRRLAEAGCLRQVTLVQASHEDLAQHIPSDLQGKVSLTVFNLGYLPGGDKSIITCWETTRPALRQALDLLKPGGLLSVVLYPGHRGGDDETQAALEWSKRLDPTRFQSRAVPHPVRNAESPFPLFIRKLP